MNILLDNGAVLNARDQENETALHGAVFGGSFEAVKFLIERGIEVNPPAPVDLNRVCDDDEYGLPLNAAAAGGHIAVMTALLENGADMSRRGGTYRATPLQLAAERGHLGAMKLLLRYGADVNAPPGRFGSALHAAASNSYD
ncbi:ankyrin, partial [Westerdykella ornata]